MMIGGWQRPRDLLEVLILVTTDQLTITKHYEDDGLYLALSHRGYCEQMKSGAPIWGHA